MTLIELREKLRVWLNQNGISEIPQYPVALFNGWHHPDILLSLFEDGPTGLFSFQMIEERSFCSGEPLSASPGLIMVVKPYTAEFFTRMASFFTAISELAGGSTGNSFVFQASHEFERTLSERGSNWDISYNGVVCGNLTVLSEVLATKIKRPAAFVSLDLAKFLRCNSAQTVKQPAQWSDTKVFDQFFASDAYLADMGGKTTVAALLQQLEKISSLNNASAALNGIIKLFLQAKVALRCNLKLSSAFVDALNRIIARQAESQEISGRREVAS